MRVPFVTSLGMCSCLGHDVVSACAAQQAGILRFSALPGTVAFDEDSDDLEAPARGAPVRLASGFIQTARWLRLALASFADLIRYGKLPPPGDSAFWSATRVMWLLPEPSFDRFLWPTAKIPELLEHGCGRALDRLLGCNVATQSVYVTQGGVAAAAALEQLEQAPSSKPVERVVLLAVDSWLDPLSLKHLERSQRLKTSANPIGLVPGEAAACVLLETPVSARQGGRRPEAVVRAVASRPPPDSRDAQAPLGRRAPAIGRQLADAIAEVLGGAGDRGPFQGAVLLDLNGEEWKGVAWGNALVRLRAGGLVGDVRPVLPCASFGDVGAASAAVAMCLATRAFKRGHARGARALVASISDQGATSAVLLDAAEPLPGAEAGLAGT